MDASQFQVGRAPVRNGQNKAFSIYSEKKAFLPVFFTCFGRVGHLFNVAHTAWKRGVFSVVFGMCHYLIAVGSGASQDLRIKIRFGL